MSLSDAIEIVGKMLQGYPNGRDVPNSYIGALANVIAQYPRCVTHRAGDPMHGVPRETTFLPTPANVIAWCEREVEDLRRIVERDDREQQWAKERERIAEAERKLIANRAVRPTLQQMQEKHGPNWGLKAAEKEDLRVRTARLENLERANRIAFERECRAAGVDPSGVASPELARLIRDKQEALAARAGERAAE